MRWQKVAGWLHGQLSLRFCRESFNSGDFFPVVFFTCRVASSRVATRAIFISRWQCDKVWKIASPARAKNHWCSRGFKVANNFEQTTKKWSKGLNISFSFKGLCHVILGCLGQSRVYNSKMVMRNSYTDKSIVTSQTRWFWGNNYLYPGNLS